MSTWTAIQNTTAGDRLKYVQNAAVQLSTGELVFLAYDPSQPDPNKVSLYLWNHVAAQPSLIATLSAALLGRSAATFLLTGPKQSLALSRDRNDNLYVVGTVQANTTFLQVGLSSGGTVVSNLGLMTFVLASRSPLTWTPKGPGLAGLTSLGSTLIQPGCWAMTWCDTSNGNTPGHLMVIGSDGFSSGQTHNFYVILNCTNALNNGSVTITAQGANPGFLGSGFSDPGNASSLDIENDGFGATIGSAIATNSTTTYTVGGWGVTSSGTLVNGASVTPQPAGSMSATTKVRIARYENGGWITIAPSTTSGALDCATWRMPTGLTGTSAWSGGYATQVVSGGGPGATLNWDVTAEPPANTTAWLYTWSKVSGHLDDLVRQNILITDASGGGSPFAFGSPVFTDDAQVGGTGTTADNLSIRLVKSPSNFLHTDWQASYVTTSGSSSAFYQEVWGGLMPAQVTTGAGDTSLLGWYTAFPAPPNAPTLLAPPTGTTQTNLNNGGTFTWSAFSSPILGDSQTAIRFKRQTGTTVDYWNGAAFVSSILTTAPVTGSSVVFPASVWAAGVNYTWTVAVVGSTNLISPYASPIFSLTVGNIVTPPPGSLSLTAVYDSTTQTVTLQLINQASTGVTGEIDYSDDGGVTWTLLRNGYPLITWANGPVTVTRYDYELSPNSVRTYRARTYNAYPQGASAYVFASAGPADVNGTFWLSDPTDGTGQSLRLKIGTFKTSQPESAGGHVLLGRTYPVIVADVMHGRDGGATFFTIDPDEETSLIDLLTRQRTLLLRTPELSQLYVRRVSMVNTERPITTRTPYREHPLNWAEVDRPPFVIPTTTPPPPPAGSNGFVFNFTFNVTM